MVLRHQGQTLATRPWLRLLLLFRLYFIPWYFAPKRDWPQTQLSPNTWLSLLLSFVGLVVWIVAFAIRSFRTMDPGVRCANKRALSRDLDGAIDHLREQIEDKGPTHVRAEAVGFLRLNFMMIARRERFEERKQGVRSGNSSKIQILLACAKRGRYRFPLITRALRGPPGMGGARNVFTG